MPMLSRSCMASTLKRIWKEYNAKVYVVFCWLKVRLQRPIVV